MKLRNCIASAVLFFGLCAFSQNKKVIDSLALALDRSSSDTARISTLLNLGWELKMSDNEKAFTFISDGIKQAEKIKDEKRLARGYQCMGAVYDIRRDFDNAIAYGLKSISLYEKLKMETALGKAYTNLSGSYRRKRDFENASLFITKAMGVTKKLNKQKEYAYAYYALGLIQYDLNKPKEALDIYQSTLTIFESLKDSAGIAAVDNSIGAIYYSQEKYESALKYWEISVKMKEAVHSSPFDLAGAYSNLSAGYRGAKNFPRAIEYIRKTEKIATVVGNKFLLGDCYNNIALVFREATNNDSALFYNRKAVVIREAIHDKRGMGQSYSNIGQILGERNKPAEAKEYFLKALDLFKGDEISHLYPVYSGLANTCEVLGDYKNGLIYNKKFHALKDSVLNFENQKQLNDMEGKYQNEKKELEISKLETEKKATNIQLNSEQNKKYFLIAGLAFVLVFSVFIFTRFRITQRQKKIIEKQKAEVERHRDLVEHQKHIVEEKQQEILDSIHYAKRIQNTLLTSEKYITKNMNRLNKQS